MRRGEDSRAGTIVFGSDGEFKHRADYKRLSLFVIRELGIGIKILLSENKSDDQRDNNCQLITSWHFSN